MVKEQVIGSYIIRFTKRINQQGSGIAITLQDIKTGEQLEFETWLSAWAFLEQVLDDYDVSENTMLSKQASPIFTSSDSEVSSFSGLPNLELPSKKSRQRVSSNALKEMLLPVG